MNPVSTFLDAVKQTHSTGVATEHSYRSAIEKLINGLHPDIRAINEPKRVACGAPDFIVHRGELPIGHVEAKDVGVSLRSMTDANKRQLRRYKEALPNLIYTNCLDWDFYRSGELVASITLGAIDELNPKAEDMLNLHNLLRDFAAQSPQTITSPQELAEKMAAKATLIRDVLFAILVADESRHDSELTGQFHAFRDNLINEISREEFADIYAETVAYGLFAARLHDPTPDGFSRQEALGLLPKSNPFLRNLFGYIAGSNLDDRIAWIIDELAAVFQAANVGRILQGFGKLTGRSDPFLHFYETFLAAYNPDKRRARGVWYTPEPVVRFIVNAVDHVLRDEFGLADGLADTTRTTIEWDTGQADRKGRPITTKKSVHQVQVLDPATGTGTFLAEVIKLVAPRVKSAAAGLWSQYVEEELIPRLHGFELLMAPYAMCHLKLDMLLAELEYQPTKAPPRLSVFLTNSLEEGARANQTLPFAQWLSNEVKEANAIKRDLPIMCIVGNPPYNPSSRNNSHWISTHMEVYKSGLNERKINLNDDYMKFLRLAELLIEKNGKGVVAMITNNSYLDGTTQRAMRLHLMQTFTSIDIYNLHGDIRSGRGDVDENVFDIMQGVSIVVMRRVPDQDTRVRYVDLAGKRAQKYKALTNAEQLRSKLVPIEPSAPYYFFVPREAVKPRDDFSLEDLFPVRSSGIQTKNDSVAIAWSAEERDQVVSNFQSLPIEELESRYPPKKVWSTVAARADISSGSFECRTITYRPFDVRHTVLTRRSGGFLGRPRFDVMQHIEESDISLVVNQKFVGPEFSHVSVARSLVAHGTHYLGNRGQDIVFPMYIRVGEVGSSTRRANIEPALYGKFEQIAAGASRSLDAMSVFDYVYGVLHSPSYRKEYAEVLRNGLPRIPWPRDSSEFWEMVDIGATLRRIHLLDPTELGDANFPFCGDGDGFVREYRLEGGHVWVNDTQHFSNVAKECWDYPIGGYQPAQKWLKDRVGRQLTYADTRHYQRILQALARTRETVDQIRFELEIA